MSFEFPDHEGFFTQGSPVFVARAPGRLDVMGGIADYSGSLVAELPIGQAALCAAQADSSGKLTIRSLNIGRTVSVATGGEKSTERWAVYLAGCVALLKAEGLLAKDAGVRLLLTSDVPLGAGVSSSAAIEVATMRAIAAAFAIELDGLTLARLCQRVENEWVGAPCGVMDQVTSACGAEGKLLLLRCQPHTIEGYTQVPTGWTVFGIDSCVKHSVGGTGYTGVRCAAFMGAKLLGLAPTDYLCNLTPESYRALGITLPDSLSGAVFLEQHGPTWDRVTTVDPKQHYPVLAATEHPIFENQRVETFLKALDAGDFALAGKQMLAAHASYSRCGLGTKETDLLVELAMEQSGVAGAKITGGGSGGTVCILCPSDREAAIAESVAGSYEKHTSTEPRVIQGTSPGALSTPVGLLQVRQRRF
ncbi:MAG: GHMP kinase [Armatimonadetes bacterium]|nr:GHMP kinase [Armatimonadota bacterium]